MKDCIFCKLANHIFETNIVYEDEVCACFLDASPVSKGHTLVVPKKHFDNVLECDDSTLSHLINVAKNIGNKQIKNLGANGVNILINTNEAAGQTVMHLHIHVIPRYDENDDIKIEFSHNKDYDVKEIIEKLK